MRTHARTCILSIAILCSCISIGLGQIAKCGSQEVTLKMKGLEDAKTVCSEESGQACQLLCVWKKIGNLSPTNQLITPNYMFLIRAFPPDVRFYFIPPAMKCISLAKEIPQNLDPNCSEFEPFIKCVAAAIPKRCTVENSTIFWKEELSSPV